MKLIGKGAFTRAYLQDSGKVLLKSSCPVKEAISMGFCGDSRFIPEIKCVDFQKYEMPFYEKPKSLKKALKPDQWTFYSELRRLYNEYKMVGTGLIIAAFKGSKLTPTQKRNMIEFVEGVANIGYDDVGFEISPRNVAVRNGRLILLDVFFFCQCSSRH